VCFIKVPFKAGLTVHNFHYVPGMR